jgi:membrane associated rhomboid family serine protease
MAVTNAVFALRYVQAPLGNVLLANLAQVNSLVAAGQWWRIFTPVLLHAFPMHILFNMWALYQLGPGVERRAGPPAYLALYFAAAGVGGAFAFHLGSATDALVGASGAIFGLFGLWFHAALRARETAFGRGLLANLGLVLLLNAALPFIYPQISWQGHLGGFVTGLIVGELWARVKDRRSQTLLALAVAAAAALSVIL